MSDPTTNGASPEVDHGPATETSTSNAAPPVVQQRSDSVAAPSLLQAHHRKVVLAGSIALFAALLLLGRWGLGTTTIWILPLFSVVLARELGLKPSLIATAVLALLSLLLAYPIGSAGLQQFHSGGGTAVAIIGLALALIVGRFSEQFSGLAEQFDDQLNVVEDKEKQALIARSLVESQNLQTIYSEIPGLIANQFGYHEALLATVDFVDGCITYVGGTSVGEDLGKSVDIQNSLIARAISLETPPLVVSTAAEENVDPPLARSAVAQIVAMPLKASNRIVGVLAMGGTESGFEERTRESLAIVGETLARAIIQRQTENALRLSQFAIDNAGEAALWGTRDGQLTYANEAACSLLGYRQRELAQKTFFDVLPDLQPGEWMQRLEKAGSRGSFSMDTSVQRSTEHLVPVDMKVSLLEWQKQQLVCAFLRDISHYKSTEAALMRSNERFELVCLGANDGHWDWDLTNNTIHLTQRWKEMLGYQPDELANTLEEWFMRVHPEDQSELRMRISAHLKGGSSHFECEYRISHRDSSWRWVLSRGLAVRDAEGQPTRMAGSMTDVTERKTAEQQLLEDAFSDGVTGLANRALFVDRLQLAIRRSQRLSDYRFAVLALDLDRFKVIVDSLGHSFSDRLLRAMGARLEACLRPGDTVARMGGDEFAILLDDIQDINDATRIADRIQKDIKPAFNLTPHEVYTSVSIGIAIGSGKYDRAEEVMRDADTALYRAKAAGRSRHEMFDTGMHSKAVKRLRMETDMQRAIKRQEFVLRYQPIVELGSGQLTGFEALIRWNHPRHGLVGPADFIPLAEETGMIVPIGQWVIREACQQLRKWHDNNPSYRHLSVAVNLSARQFSQPDLCKSIANTIRDSGINPEQLHLEITESVLMEDVARASNVLEELNQLKCKLLMDDFGTGYSSLSYLHTFPIRCLKIDRSFISSNGNAHLSNGEIVRTILTLAHNLGMDATAEGIEEQAQLDELRGLNCTFGQGFLFAKPLDVAAIDSMLNANPSWPPLPQPAKVD